MFPSVLEHDVLVLLAAIRFQGPVDRALVRLRGDLAVPPALWQVVPKADTAIDDPGADTGRRAGIHAMLARVRLGELGLEPLAAITQVATDLSRTIQSTWANAAVAVRRFVERPRSWTKALKRAIKDSGAATKPLQCVRRPRGGPASSWRTSGPRRTWGWPNACCP